MGPGNWWRTIATEHRGWLVLAAVALGLRLLTLAVLDAPGRAATFEHGEIAARLLRGEGFAVTFLGQTGPTSQQAPWVPLVLAGCYALAGAGSPAALVAFQLLQCLVGTATVLGVAWLARQWLDDCPAAMWVAGYAAALYPPHVYMVTHIQVATWATGALVGCLALAATPSVRRSGAGAAAIGAASGVALLIEPIFALVVGVLALAVAATPLMERAADPSTARPRQALWPALGRALFVPLVALLVITPWLVRNRQVHGEWVFVKSTFGYALWQGNNPRSYGTDKIPKPGAAQLARAHDGSLADMNRALWSARRETLYIDDVLLAPSGYGRFAGLSEPARSRLLGSEAWAWILDHPGDYFRLCLRRLRYLMLFDETNPKASHPLYQVSTVVWLVLSGVGGLTLGRRWRAAWPGLAACGLLVAFHALTITSPRFRLPIEAVGMVGVAWAVTPLGQRLASRLADVNARKRTAATPAQLPPVDPPHPLRGPHRRPGVPARRRDRLGSARRRDG